MLTGSSSPSSAAPTSISISQPLFVVVDFICFLLEPAMNFIVKGLDRVKDKKLCSLPVSCLSRGCSLCSSALVLCPLHQFNRKLDGQPRWSSDVSCSNRRTCSVCAGCGRPTQLLLDEADTEHLACEAIVGTKNSLSK